MKKYVFRIILTVLLFSLLALYPEASDIRYDIDIKQVLNDFDSGSDATVNMEPGGSHWGSRWAEADIGTQDGLDNTANALSVKISEYSDGDGIILTGFEGSYLGGSDTFNDWTAGEYLLVRIKNNTSTPFNLTPALDVNDGSDGRVRVWADGKQQLPDTEFNAVETTNVYALNSDGVSYGDRLCYTTIPGKFDGWLLVPRSDYEMGVGQYECISNDSFDGIDWTQVMHFTCMVQDASKADFTVDTIVLADAAPAAVPEPAETEAAEVAAGAAETRPETAPKTADFAALTLLAGAAALVLTRRKALRK
jgi:hypothetical protein